MSIHFHLPVLYNSKLSEEGRMKISIREGVLRKYIYNIMVVLFWWWWKSFFRIPEKL